MMLFLHKTLLLTKREFKRNFRSIGFITTLFLPLLIIFLYFERFKQIPILKQQAFSLFFNLNVLTISMISFSVIVLSDRENKVDKVLSETGVKFYEMMLAKNLLALFIITINQIILSFLYRFSLFTSVIHIILGIILGTIIQYLVTTICYVSDNQSLISNVTSIIFIFLLMTPELIELVNPIRYLAYLLPTYYIKAIVDYTMNITVDVSFFKASIVLLCWISVPTIILKYKSVLRSS